MLLIIPDSKNGRAKDFCGVCHVPEVKSNNNVTMIRMLVKAINRVTPDSLIGLVVEEIDSVSTVLWEEKIYSRIDNCGAGMGEIFV